MQQKTFTMQTVIGWLLSLVLVVLVSQSVYCRRLDCTKFVFAPRCRGVAAKRGLAALYPAVERKRADVAGPAYSLNNDVVDSGDLLALALAQPGAALPDSSRKTRLRQLALKLLQLEADIPQTQDAWPATGDDSEYRED